MENHVEYNPGRCALLAKGAMVIQGRKQTEVAKKIGTNRVLLNLYLNRKINFLDSDIKLLLTELGLAEAGAKLSGRTNEKDDEKTT